MYLCQNERGGCAGSAAGRSPTPARTCRRWPARIPRGLRREHSWREKRCRRHRLVSLRQSRSLRGRGLQFHRQEGPMIQGSINDTGEQPLCPCRRVRQNCPCQGCSPAKKSNLNFMFPSALRRFRRHLLAVPAGCDVCCMLQCASDGRVWTRG